MSTNFSMLRMRIYTIDKDNIHKCVVKCILIKILIILVIKVSFLTLIIDKHTVSTFLVYSKIIKLLRSKSYIYIFIKKAYIYPIFLFLSITILLI